VITPAAADPTQTDPQTVPPASVVQQSNSSILVDGSNTTSAATTNTSDAAISNLGNSSTWSNTSIIPNTTNSNISGANDSATSKSIYVNLNLLWLCISAYMVLFI